MEILAEKDRQAYKEFLENNERCNFQQSIEWGKVKTSWKNEIIISRDESRKNSRGNECFNKKNTYFWEYSICVKRTHM